MTHVAPLKILKASAGSGKTFSLTLHYITLLLNNENSYREILAVTFTNKATAEMKERILSVLQGLATGNVSDNIESFRKLLINQNPNWSAALIQEKAHRVYRKILHDYSHFTISTIDGFSQKVIRSFTYELNLDAAYKIEMNTNKVKTDLTMMLNQLLDEKPELLDWIIAYAEKKINNNENWNYRNQLSQLAGLIFTENFQEFDGALASADTNQIFNLLNKDIFEKTQSYLESLSLAIQSFQETFKALQVDVNEMKGKSRNPLVSANKITPQVQKLSLSGLIELLGKYTKLIDNEEAYTDKDKNLRYDLIEGFRPVLSQFVTLEQLLPTYIAYQSVQSNLYYLRLLKEMSDLLSTWRKENSAQLISDSQILLNKLGLDAHNDPTFIWEKIGNRYNYFLFDEFQDTSRIQWKNYSPILLNALSNTEGVQHEHLIVGDVKQSIYRWRNGDWRILLQQVEEQVAQNFHLDTEGKNHFIDNGILETNFRSLPNIIRFNNYLYQAIPAHMQNVLNDTAKNELSEEGLRWWKNAQNDSMLVRAYENSAQEIPEKKLNNPDKQGSIEIEYIKVEDSRWRANQAQEESTRKLCEKIGEWISTGRYEAKQIGILVRSNRQAVEIIQKLMEYKNATGLHFDVISGDALSLVSNDAINLLVESLKAFVYTSDKHVIHHARMAYLYQIITKQKSFEPEAWLHFKENNIEKLQSLLPDRLIIDWDVWQKLPLVHLVEKLIEIYGFTSDNNVHLPYILTFKDIVGNFTASGERGINQFLEFWEEDGNKAVLPSSGKVNAIEVTTIHKSKGLAYDVVMIPFCSWTLDGMTNGDFWINTENTPFGQLGRIPIKYTSSVGKSIFYQQYFEEKLFNYMDALNTLYVATTRTKEHIYITAPAFATDKKSGELKICNDLISDVIYQVLDHPNAPFPLEEEKVQIDHIIPKEDSNDSDTPCHIALERYPISVAMEKALEKNSTRTINTILMLEKASQYGILAHEVMAEASKESDIHKIIARYIDEGILAVENKDLLEKEIYQIWHHPQINQWLSGDYKIWNESAIITADGRTLRPDKVFTKEDETIILDFKFTGDNYIEHKTQVDQYMKALQNLGYQNIRGFLFYAKVNELVEVK
ncbi:UvrD-helicase domain-containing protein [Sphingobacterium sp. SGL-16]|uniref:UvrD-helicase domain-containing protein n=1 Tax=Sphingobacterium sp. SGL-16 TaxID=2710883 RepID=UPI0013E9C00B|nr:UvrD-helicase domain-containing protein [Sphingobacterium sp. SGL-16]NGM74145.1 UvrD-helicase domain-containing protein [Sphingobacterium sp. SGL-16]